MANNTQSWPRITVVTPSYNQGQFLEETLRSVLDQNYPNLELIVIDGGSTDNSVEIIRRYAPRLAYWVSERDKGQSEAINKGFARATGDILTWLNSDDCLCPGSLVAVAEFFQQHPEFGAVIGDQEVIDGAGRQVDFKKSVPVGFWLAFHSACAIPQPATIFTRQALAAAGPIDESIRYQMDYDFFLRMLHAGVRFSTLQVPIAKFRLHGDSKTVSKYDTLVWDSNRRIQNRFLGWSSPRTAWQERRMRGLKHLARTWLYLSRAVRRGSFALFRNTRARQQAMH